MILLWFYLNSISCRQELYMHYFICSDATADCAGSEIKEIHHFRLLGKELVSNDS